MWWRLACVVVAAALAHEPASAQDSAAQFYKGKQITVIVGSSAGGGYDIYARLLSRHMPKHIPGNPAMVVTNMTGAGSNAAAAHLFNVAPRDGTVIGALQNSAVLDSLLDALLGDTRRLRHDATKFVHLGSATIDHYVCIARADAPVKSFKELLTRELIIGASQPGTSTRDYPAMLNNLTGTKIRLVSGYPGTREITLAIEKDEVKGLCGFSWSSLKAQRPDWLQSGFIRVLVQEHDKGHPDIRGGQFLRSRKHKNSGHFYLGLQKDAGTRPTTSCSPPPQLLHAHHSWSYSASIANLVRALRPLLECRADVLDRQLDVRNAPRVERARDLLVHPRVVEPGPRRVVPRRGVIDLAQSRPVNSPSTHRARLATRVQLARR